MDPKSWDDDREKKGATTQSESRHTECITTTACGVPVWVPT